MKNDSYHRPHDQKRWDEAPIWQKIGPKGPRRVEPVEPVEPVRPTGWIRPDRRRKTMSKVRKMLSDKADGKG